MKKLITQFYNLKFAGFKTLLFLFLGAMSVVNVFGQVEVFYDNLDRSAYTSPQSGGTPTAAWTTGTGSNGAITMSLNSGADYSLRMAGTGTAGNTFSYIDNSVFSSPYSAIAGLANTAGVITWYFNTRYFNSSSSNYRQIIVLAASNSDFNNAGCVGYAVYYRKTTTSRFSLAKFSGGVQTGVTDVIPEIGSNDIAAVTNYASVKITYNPATNNWSMYVRDDGASAYAVPWTGSYTQHGSSVIDNTYTSNLYNLKYSGFYYYHNGTSTSSTYRGNFDNFKVIVTPISVNSNSLSGFTYELGSGPSVSQSFNLSATNLTGFPSNITVTGTTNYEVSTDNSTFSSSVNVPYTSATLGATPIYVRLKAGLSVLNYNNEVITTSIGAASGSTVTCSGSVYGTPTTYTWNATGTASFATASNWTPTRTTPQTNDILQFNGGGTVVATDLTSQTIAQLLVSNNTSLELQSVAAATLTIAGSTGTDLSVGAGSALNIAQTTNAITLAVGTGATGSVAGSMTYSNAAHRLTAADASGITFQNGSSFTVGTGFSGNAFGTTNLNSIVFASGSTYVYVAGGNPFGATGSSSVVVWQAGSLYKHTSSNIPSIGTRTYADFELDAPGVTITSPSSQTLNINNLIITNGTYVFDVRNTFTINNITVASAGSLEFSPASSATVGITGNVIIAAGGKLTNNTNSTLNASNLTINSNASGTGTFLNNGICSLSGTTTVQQYLPDARNWYVSSPVTGAVAPAGYSYFQRDEVASSWITRPFAADSIFLRGHGYIALPAAAASTLVFSGTLNNGNINTTLTKSGSGFNLIGNPYPCHLGWTYDFANANAALIESSIWVRTNAGTANNSGQWSFATFNAVALESVPSVANAGIIAPMQAFWVKAKTAGTLTLNSNLTRSHQSSNPLKVPTVKNTNRQRIRLQVSNGLTFDETLLYFDANASAVFDAYDSPKISNNIASIPEIYTLAGNEKLVINGMNQPAYDVEIPLGFTTGQATNFTISKIEMSNFETGTRLLLKDKLNTSSEFDLSQGDAYNFSSEILNSSNNRFSLVLKAPGTTTGHKPQNASDAQVFVNAANQITIIAPEKSNYTIYNAVGQLIENGILKSELQTANCKLQTGIFVVKVNNQSTRVIIK